MQIDAEHSFPFNMYNYGDSGIGQQVFQTGFNNYPGDLDYDYFWFRFVVDMPHEYLPDGEVVYQWATFRDLDDESAPVYSIGCQATVGDPLKTKIELFIGDSSMKNDSLKVMNRTWDDQNAENNFYGHAYVPMSNPDVYEQRPSSTYSDTNAIQNCFAMINIDNKVNRAQHEKDGKSVFNRRYDVTLGARLYENDNAKKFIGLPDNSFTWRFGEPRYEHPEPEVTEKEITEQKLNTPAKKENAVTLRFAVGTLLASAALLSF